GIPAADPPKHSAPTGSEPARSVELFEALPGLREPGVVRAAGGAPPTARAGGKTARRGRRAALVVRAQPFARRRCAEGYGRTGARVTRGTGTERARRSLLRTGARSVIPLVAAC